jgi:DNA-binding CsgD family transcriptional regulator
MTISTDISETKAALWRDVNRLAGEVAALGQSVDLPATAASSNLASPHPMRNEDGRPYAETHFKWVGCGSPYWLNRKLALSAPFLKAVRVTAEPFYFDGAALYGWRQSGALADIDVSKVMEEYGVASGMVAPVHLPFGRLGAVVWCSGKPTPTLPTVFNAMADKFLAMALKFVSAHAEAANNLSEPVAVPTAREVQCLRWAAFGKTDGEIGDILGISTPTVRFHIKNASGKLGAFGRSQAVYRAAMLGYVADGR